MARYSKEFKEGIVRKMMPRMHKASLRSIEIPVAPQNEIQVDEVIRQQALRSTQQMLNEVAGLCQHHD